MTVQSIKCEYVRLKIYRSRGILPSFTCSRIPRPSQLFFNCYFVLKLDIIVYNQNESKKKQFIEIANFLEKHYKMGKKRSHKILIK